MAPSNKIHVQRTFTSQVHARAGRTPNDAREDIRNSWHREPSQDDVAAWVVEMKEILASVEAGKRYVILDGTVIPAREFERPSRADQRIPSGSSNLVVALPLCGLWLVSCRTHR